ncbi:MAG: hypothetical protein Q8S73_43135 [Deltaproteobacteria bacterium]|nr:hypothetical protein [Myxococcales bacterium]MDP3220958.1 hypothetical protein [Deltaproteobacteria bacterium]
MAAELHPGVAELARDLEINERMNTAAEVIRAGLVAMASSIVADLLDPHGALRHDVQLGRIYADQVRAWAAGDLSGLAASNVAWGRNGCRDCARRALGNGDGESRCNLCSFNQSAREARS